MVNLRCSLPVCRSACRVSFALTIIAGLLLFADSALSRAQAVEEKVHVAPIERMPGDATSRRRAVDPKLSPGIKPLRVDVDLVLVPVTITDTMSRPVVGLEQRDFALYEDNVPQEIRFFSTEDVPISVGVILDTSKSMSNKIDDAREAVSEFFQTANPEDEYFVISFSDRPAVVADSTRSIGYIQNRLAATKPGGHTALLDAIYLGMAKLRQATYPRRALLIISDGGDNHSRYTASEIKNLVQEGDVQIYGIGLFDRIFKTPEEWAGKRLLTEITQATGGRTITIENARDLPAVAAEVSLELRNQYILGYHSNNVAHDGKWRRIKVRMGESTRAARAQVYCRRGYLAATE